MQTNIIVYRDQLLPYSETFILSQVEKYVSYKGYYVGTSRLRNQLNIPADRCITLDAKKPFSEISKTLYKLLGYPPIRWLNQIKALSPCLIHAHFGLDGVLALPLAQRLKLPLIVTFHGYYATAEPAHLINATAPSYWLDFIHKRGRFFRNLYFQRRQALFQSATCVIAVSEYIQQALIQKGCPPDKIRVHYIGVDVDKFHPDSTITRQPYVLFVGRLVEKKGCEYLIRAMAQVESMLPEVELVIIGDGPLRSHLETLAANTLTRYRFEGVQPPAIVKDWMAKAQVLVAPSVTTAQNETEGLPIVILEAMATGLPVVASRHAGIPEAIIHDEVGLLTAERDWPSLSQAIVRLLQDSRLWQQFSRASRQRVEEVFNLRANTQKLEDLYTQLLLAHTPYKP